MIEVQSPMRGTILDAVFTDCNACSEYEVDTVHSGIPDAMGVGHLPSEERLEVHLRLTAVLPPPQ